MAYYNNMEDMKIKNIIKEERPRERFIKYGVENLSNEELLSIILKTGTREYSVKRLALILLNELGGIEKLRSATINTLTKIKGIGQVKAIELLSIVELSKRMNMGDVNSVKLNNSKVIFDYFKHVFQDEKQEYFYAIYLDTKSKLISFKLLFKGTLNSSTVHPREIFKYAFLESAASIIVIHNHPSGDVNPSIQDIELTKSLMKIGSIIKIPVIDHIIIGKDKYYSFYEYMNKLKNKL